MPEPEGVVTITFTAPADPEGVTAVIVVLLTTVTLVAAAPPRVTPVAPVKLVPVIVIDCAPAIGPAFGEIAVTVGSAS